MVKFDGASASSGSAQSLSFFTWGSPFGGNQWAIQNTGIKPELTLYNTRALPDYILATIC